MFGSKLQKTLRAWIKGGGDLGQRLYEQGDLSVRSVRDAATVCEALHHAIHLLPNEREVSSMVSTPLHSLTSLFQEAETESAYEALSKRGLPLLAKALEEGLYGQRFVSESDILFLLKVMVAYQFHPLVRHVAHAIRKRLAPNHYMWPVIFAQFGEQGHPHARSLVDALAATLPDGLIGISYLKLVNTLCSRDAMGDHPYASLQGQERLKRLITNTDPIYWPEASEATRALAFIPAESRRPLLALASRHPDPRVQIDVIGVEAEDGDEDAFAKLAQYARDPRYSKRASWHLRHLGKGNLIPESTRDPGFAALVKVSEALELSEDFSTPPDEIQIVEADERLWPRIGLTACWLCRFVYHGRTEAMNQTGWALVTTRVTLYAEADASSIPNEDLYALFAALEDDDSSTVSATLSVLIQQGREILQLLDGEKTS